MSFYNIKILLPIITFFVMQFSLSQNVKPTSDINGTYHLLEAERGVKTKFFEFGEHNGVQLLAIAACQKCIPGVYTYQKEDSESIDRLVFFNKAGLHIINYDDESFVMIMLNPNAEGDWTDFYFSNFYSKNKAKVAAMSKEKIKNFIVSLEDS